ncbi:MAG TPA: creatininase family protein [Bacteroidales bacterium]|nr:creatininase family protein [Bacteroidales bacterium]HOD55823.1 creatininase family protein [Bacteroidales bacterium]HOF76550.1 creatininase family protein [Bacteroidales bacterium]HOG32787.1 creatininase family protein [Bacteroidales bacterium]HOZ10196.1 creatininase family protein [Bacteroidales bacterium]
MAWEELTSADFKKATGLAQGVCIIPIGVIEKHAQHLPLGTDVYAARHIALTAAKGEYAVVFPFYFAGQIFEARHQPGTIAYSSRMLYDLLDETCREIARNGFDKIIIVNGHGGNTNFLQYFCQTQLEGERNYAVFLFTPTGDKETDRKITELRKSTIGGHADEEETAVMRVIRPDLVHMDRVALESGRDQARLPLPGTYTGIWWYARYPNHYAGDATGSDPEIGRLSLDSSVAQLQKVIGMLKAETGTLELQYRFFKEAGEH